VRTRHRTTHSSTAASASRGLDSGSNVSMCQLFL
jgi:hypothetical protein